jgi:CrcB protein
MSWLAVAVGGALGSLARHGVNQIVHGRWLMTRFPVGIVVVNLIGCFSIGFLAGLVASDRLVLRETTRQFVFVGLLGGFTTFSSFGLDTFTLARGGAATHAALNVALQVIGGLVAVGVGYALAMRLR